MDVGAFMSAVAAIAAMAGMVGMAALFDIGGRQVVGMARMIVPGFVGVVVTGSGTHDALAAHRPGAYGPAARVFPGILLS